jgi:hypothetical protein
MPNRTSSAKTRIVTASMIRTALGDALGKIRIEEGMTWVELGEELGKCDDQAVRYVDGTAEMSVGTYYRAKQRWNGRFTGAADKLIADASPEQDPQTAQSCILRAALALSTALEDGTLTTAEIAANRSTLEQSKDAIDALLGRLIPREIVA